MMGNPLSRRRVLQSTAALAATSALASIGRSARADTDKEKRLVVIFLRGGLDGLAAAPPFGDPAYRATRSNLALAPPGEADGIIDLDGFFGLHPTLSPLLPFYRRGELLIVHALASTHRGRSHFDAQNLIENGTAIPYGAEDGWLNRALGLLDAKGHKLGLAVGAGIPLLIRGDTPIATWSPTILPAADAGFLMQLANLYAEDPLLGPALAEGINAQGTAANLMDDSRGGAAGARRGLKAFQVNVRAAGELLAASAGPRVAVLELGGWDTHALQGTTDGRLNYYLEALAESLVTLRAALADAWQSSVVLVMTEFGRTVAPNGTGGTDHGTGGTALLAGGAVAGGRVVSDWPGLADDQLLEGRDLRPTIETRAVFKGLLRDQLGVAESAIEDYVFPQSRGVHPLPGLVRL